MDGRDDSMASTRRAGWRLTLLSAPATVATAFAALGTGPVPALVLGAMGGGAIWAYDAITRGTIL